MPSWARNESNSASSRERAMPCAAHAWRWTSSTSPASSAALASNPQSQQSTLSTILAPRLGNRLYITSKSRQDNG